MTFDLAILAQVDRLPWLFCQPAVINVPDMLLLAKSVGLPIDTFSSILRVLRIRLDGIGQLVHWPAVLVSVPDRRSCHTVKHQSCIRWP